MPETTLRDRAVIRLSGEGVRDFLQGLVTSDVAGALPVWTGLLTPQGKCLFDFLVWDDGDNLLLDCETASADNLAKRLSIYRLRRAITIVRDEGLAVHWAKDGTEGVADPRHSELGKRWVSRSPAQAGFQPEPEGRSGPPSGSGPRPAQGNPYLEHRLRLGVCEGTAELGDLLWLECNAIELNGVSFTKGCFVGQENTARMNWRSKVNRRLLVVEGDCGATGQEKRVRVAYPELGLAVVHARLDAIPANAIRPEWLNAALSEAAPMPALGTSPSP